MESIPPAHFLFLFDPFPHPFTPALVKHKPKQHLPSPRTLPLSQVASPRTWHFTHMTHRTKARLLCRFIRVIGRECNFRHARYTLRPPPLYHAPLSNPPCASPNFAIICEAPAPPLFHHTTMVANTPPVLPLSARTFFSLSSSPHLTFLSPAWQRLIGAFLKRGADPNLSGG